MRDNYHLTYNKATSINMLSHLSDCFPFASLTVEVQTVGQRTDRGAQSLKSDTHNVVCQEDISEGDNSCAPLPLCSDVDGLYLYFRDRSHLTT